MIVQLPFILFNLINSRIDAYRILKHKTIAHGINFGAYFALYLLLYFILKPSLLTAILMGISAFFCRQITFDIPLNLRRGLKWFHVSTATPPKAVLDRLEIKFLGRNGKRISAFYAGLWIIFIILIQIFGSFKYLL